MIESIVGFLLVLGLVLALSIVLNSLDPDNSIVHPFLYDEESEARRK